MSARSRSSPLRRPPWSAGDLTLHQISYRNLGVLGREVAAGTGWRCTEGRRQPGEEIVDVAGARLELGEITAGGVVDVLPRLHLDVGQPEARQALCERPRGRREVTREPAQRRRARRGFR